MNPPTDPIEETVLETVADHETGTTSAITVEEAAIETLGAGEMTPVIELAGGWTILLI